MPPRSTELAILPEGVPANINAAPTPQNYHENGGLTFKTDLNGQYIVREEEFLGHKVYVGEGLLNAKFPRETELKPISVLVYGDKPEDIQKLMTATDRFQQALAEGHVPALDPVVQQALDQSHNLSAPRFGGVPGFILARDTTYLLSYGDRVDEFLKLDPSERNRFITTIKAGLIPIVFTKPGVEQAGFTDKVLEIARDNHATAERLDKPITLPRRDNASPEVSLPEKNPDVLTFFETSIRNPYFLLNIRGKVDDAAIEEAKQTTIQKLTEVGDLFLERTPNRQVGAALKSIYEILAFATQSYGGTVQSFENVLKGVVANNPGTEADLIPSLDFQTRYEVMRAISNNQFGEQMEKMPVLYEQSRVKGLDDPSDPLVQIQQILTNPYLFVGLKGFFTPSDIRRAYTAYGDKIKAAKENLVRQGHQHTRRYELFSAFELLHSAYQHAAITLEEQVLGRTSGDMQLTIRNLDPIRRYQALVKLRNGNH